MQNQSHATDPASSEHAYRTKLEKNRPDQYEDPSVKMGNAPSVSAAHIKYHAPWVPSDPPGPPFNMMRHKIAETKIAIMPDT